MVELICFLFPGVASAFFAEKLMERTVTTRSLCFLVALNTILTNVAVMAIKAYVLASPDIKFSSVYGIDSALVVKYLVMSLAVGFFAAVVEAVFSKYFYLRLIDKKQKEKGKEE